MTPNLSTQLISLHQALEKNHIPHAFGGAIALAFYGQPRATHDIDLNIFLPPEHYDTVMQSLSFLFPLSDEKNIHDQIMRDAQTRLHWDTTPIDIFFSNDAFFDSVATRSNLVEFKDTTIPILSMEDLIICKATYDRAKDWLDIETILQIQQKIDKKYISAWMNELFGPESNRSKRVEGLFQKNSPGIPERK